MKILLVGGFFGSGKSTVLLRSSGYLSQRDGIAISAIRDGCVCCQVTGNLIEALMRAETEYAPDWVLVEQSFAKPFVCQGFFAPLAEPGGYA